MPQNIQNEIIQTVITHYNQFRSFRDEALIWLQITTDTGEKIKVETEVKERYQKLIDVITIETIKVEQQKSSDQDIITFPMNTIINISFNKNPI